MLIVPEITLFNSIKAILKFVRDDYNTNLTDTTKSLLYQVLHNNSTTTNDGKVQRYNLFDQGIKVFITKETDERHLDVNLFFNAARASIPTLHITLPSEQEKNNSLGLGEGIEDPIYMPDKDSPLTYKKKFNRRFSPTYNLVITSNNTNEIILIYHFLRSILISLTPSLNMTGLENIRLSGGDININQELVPQGIFSRVIGIGFEYNVETVELLSHQVKKLNEIIVDQTMTLE